MKRVAKRNATFQRWSTLLNNRTKRHRAGEMIVHGVRPITMAVRAGLPVRSLLFDGRPKPSTWARQLMLAHPDRVVLVAPELLAELGERDDVPELLAVVAMPPDDLTRIPSSGAPIVVAFDRPGNPGNIGTLARSVDALGGAALVTTGHSADLWDPQAIRASTGAVFSIPAIRLPSHAPLLEWVDAQRRAGMPYQIVGTDESGDIPLERAPWAGPVLLVVGSETAGMSAAWRDACDVVVRIPMAGEASSLNAATAGSITLYEGLRQRAVQRVPRA